MKFKRDSRRKTRAVLDITPLIDVMFNLIIFFMLSSTFVVQSSIPIEVPEANATETLDANKSLTITITHGTGGPDGLGAVLVDDAEIGGWEEMVNALTDITSRDPEALVLIRPDANISTGRLIKIIDMVMSAGITHYTIAAEAPDEEG